MYLSGLSRREAVAIVAVAILHVAIAYLALRPSIIELPAAEGPVMIAEITQPAPEPEVPPEPAKARAPRPEGAASAANKRARPSEVVAPPPAVEVPPPIVAAPVAATGPDVSAGAAPVAGPGTGSGGAGTGFGSGGQGSGTGGGGGGSARWVKGRIKDSDYPRAAARAEIGGAVIVNFDVGTNGRASNCRVVSSSGNADLDRTTCRLIEKRFRYEPATDAQGRPVPSVVAWRQEWWLEPDD